MKNNDIIRSVDTVLSGLTVSEGRREALVRRAMGTQSAAVHGEHRGRGKLRFSLSFGPSHMIVAAIVVVIVMIAPLFVPEQTEFFDNWQYGDGEFYMVDGVRKEQNSQVAEADNRPGEMGFFTAQSAEEARQYYGAGLPVLQWIPDRFSADIFNVTVMEDFRSCTAVYNSDGGPIIFEITDYFDPTAAYTYISQDGTGEYITLDNGTQVYATTNAGYQTLVWAKGRVNFLISGSFTREEAIRMAESVQSK